MKFVAEFRDSSIIKELAERINRKINLCEKDQLTFMEVCGTHTVVFYRHGLRSLLSKKIRLLSGPGCPICVTPVSYIDKAIYYARLSHVIIATFGDIMRVPGTISSLEKEKANGSNIQIIYSPLDVLNIAERYNDKKIIFLGIGFETTAPTVALAIYEAKKRKYKNFFVFSGLKSIPPVLRTLVETREIQIDGFICPGHVSTVIGAKAYEFIPLEFGIPCVIAGFEPVDIMLAIDMLIEQNLKKEAKVEIEYTRSVKFEGNIKALNLISTVFKPVESEWRGLGIIQQSGLKINQEYSDYDAELQFPIIYEKTNLISQGSQNICICGEILRGVKSPNDCPSFRTICTPATPLGACMVSSEGTCSAYYKYAV